MHWFRKPKLESEFQWTIEELPQEKHDKYRMENFLRFYFDRVRVFDRYIVVEKGEFGLKLIQGDRLLVQKYDNKKVDVLYESGGRYLEVTL